VTVGGEEARGQGENLVELLDGSERDDVGATGLTLLMRGDGGFVPFVGVMRVVKAGQDSLSALGYYIDVHQCKRADYLAKEGGFLVIRFDERQMNFGGPDLYRKTGESGAGAEVDDAGSLCWLCSDCASGRSRFWS